MVKNNLTFRFMQGESPLPLLKCKTESGNEFLILVDSGSEITLLDNSLNKDIYHVEKAEGDIILQSLHGEEETEQFIGILKVHLPNVNNEEQSLRIYGITSDLSSISNFMKDTYNINDRILAVVGSDTLTRNGAVIDFEQERISM